MAKIALINGAIGGLGQAIAKKLLLNDWQLILVGRDAEKLNTAFGEKSYTNSSRLQHVSGGCKV
ncbi:MAG: SDR family NAD(P)-dependent oxidoreductase [Bdellovibrio sp.]|nr:SDR family NAD(P)-dependent oxidoreductase [Methylotenera sp.]